MKPLHILHVEDSRDDSDLIEHMLHREGIDCKLTRIETRPQLFDALQNESFDIILSDCKLPNFSGLHALEIAHALKPETPFVFVSGTIGEETAIESLRNGATDYVLKDRLSRLVPAVRRALAEANERTLCRKMQQRLREVARLEAISTLSSGIAHDFNNILTIVLGHASLLAAENNHPERVLKIAGTITDAGHRASEIVQQLLAFSRKSDGHPSPLDLNRYLRENLPLLKEKLPTGVQLSLELSLEPLPLIHADTSQLELILANLFDNSAESMPEGGQITLSTLLTASPDFPGSMPDLAGGSYLCLKVADTGMGMDPITREHIFEPFYTTKERGHATGLGLPVVYGLMQAHHGQVGVDSEPGKGTTISLYFPAPDANQASSEATLPGEDDALRGSETILVVEDETDVAFFLETIFQNHGYHVLIAHTGNEALKLFNQHRDHIQLVFSDIGLPRMDGITLCTSLRQQKPHLPVILASGYALREFKDRMDDLAPEAFLAKPFKTQDILQCVRSVLDVAYATA